MPGRWQRQNCVSDEKSLGNKGAHTLLTGVCALCEADSPDSQMSGLFCVTPFRTRGCPLATLVRLSQRTLRRKQSTGADHFRRRV